MTSLWVHWPKRRRAAVSAKHVCLCLDFDGTLVPIADHPSHARLSARTKQLLTRLAGRANISVALISGRALQHLKVLIGIRGVYYVGNHGLELHGPKVYYVNPVAQSSRPMLKRIVRSLRVALRPIPGAWIEDKGLTLSVHWRTIPQSAHPQFRQLISRYTMPYLKQHAIRVTQGKRVVEIRPPVEWDKGRMIDWLVRHLSVRRDSGTPYVLYLGDDRTDESAFRVTNRLRGLSVFVGHRRHPTAARYWLRSPREVHRWLAALLTKFPDALRMTRYTNLRCSTEQKSSKGP